MSIISKYFRRPIIVHNKKVKYIIRRTKQQNLDTLILSTDTLYASDLQKIGIARYNAVIKGAERRLKLKIIPLNSRSWEIIR